MATSAHLGHPLILHNAADPYLELIQAAAQHLGTAADYVEKDYSATLAVKGLSEVDWYLRFEKPAFKGI